MRIIGGKYGGRRITPPAGMPHTRPTTDRAREALFNILEHAFSLEGTEALDLFAGTGLVSFELASRGAARTVAVEKDARQLAFIRSTAAALAIEGLELYRMDAFRYIRQCAGHFDFIFADPPYRLKNLAELPSLVFGHQLLRPGGWLVLEHDKGHDFGKEPFFSQKRNYGTTIFSIFIHSTAD
jgi:16S rRNA (guanine(966)-N(2))-methyltransferase RsmD